jgi:general bacterial porin, GBP family
LKFRNRFPGRGLYRARTLALAVPVGFSIGISSSAHAQSSITLTGNLDAGVLYANNSNGHSVSTATSGQIVPSRFWLRGKEDLGGGLAAVFTLLLPFNIQNGRGLGAREFNVSYVGLSDQRWGTLTFGRQWDPTIDAVGNFASAGTWAGVVGSHVGDSDNTDVTIKTSNTVKYSSPDLAGFKWGASYAFSNAASSSDGSGFTDNRSFAGGASYARGPLALGIGFWEADRPNGQSAGAIGSTSSSVVNDYGNVFDTSVNGAGVLRQRTYLAGGSYQFGRFGLGGIFTRVQFDYLDATSLSLDNYEVNAGFQWTPTLRTSIAYIRTDGRYEGTGTASPGWDQINVGALYALSKRTRLYLIGVAQQGRHADAQIYGVSPSSTRRQLVVTTGAQTNF